jgi:hypothetical protein
MSKGSLRRPTNEKEYGANWDLIFNNNLETEKDEKRSKQREIIDILEDGFIKPRSRNTSD